MTTHSSSLHSIYDESSWDGGESQLYDNERDEVEELRRLSSADTKRVHAGRLSVTIVVLTAASLVSANAYMSLTRKETKNFKTAFSQVAKEVGNAEIQHQRDILLGLRTLADTFTASALEANATWPFYHLNSYEMYATNACRQSGAELITPHPLVKEDEVEEFLAFVDENYERWRDESHLHRYGTLNNTNKQGYKSFIAGIPLTDPDQKRDVYYPFTMSSPPPRTDKLFNWNIGTVPDYEAIIDAVLSLQSEAPMTQVRSYAKAVDNAFTKEQHDAFHSPLAPHLEEHPHSFRFHPVTKTLEPDSDIVMVLKEGNSWDHAFYDLLTEEEHQVTAVFENTCNQVFTYLLDGGTPYFQGMEDLHDRDYTDLGLSFDLTISRHPDFRGTPGHCLYSLTVYPTKEFKAFYTTSTPQRTTVMVATTFGFILAAFFFLDSCVRRRNTTLVANAARSNAIVTELFPGDIRDKIMDSNMPKCSNDEDVEQGEEDDKPLADLFVNTTILFADISGFTAWSSSREPHHVFILLEELFRAFDKVAKRRNIFKVETVGDCYVGASGLPTPRRDHAVAMARFAQDIMKQMSIVSRDLEEKLGSDTANLSLRIGIHSGPITAGVLRGQRRRFQLFGDTINTAARLQTTGQIGKIHISTACANELIQFGKGDWIQKRDEKVQAKGKGELETYWLQRPQGDVTSASGSDGLPETLDESFEVESGGEGSIHL